jgi:hypothetical protein
MMCADGDHGHVARRGRVSPPGQLRLDVFQYASRGKTRSSATPYAVAAQGNLTRLAFASASCPATPHRPPKAMSFESARQSWRGSSRCCTAMGNRWPERKPQETRPRLSRFGESMSWGYALEGCYQRCGCRRSGARVLAAPNRSSVHPDRKGSPVPHWRLPYRFLGDRLWHCRADGKRAFPFWIIVFGGRDVDRDIVQRSGGQALATTAPSIKTDPLHTPLPAPPPSWSNS